MPDPTGPSSASERDKLFARFLALGVQGMISFQKFLLQSESYVKAGVTPSVEELASVMTSLTKAFDESAEVKALIPVDIMKMLQETANGRDVIEIDSESDIEMIEPASIKPAARHAVSLKRTSQKKSNAVVFSSEDEGPALDDTNGNAEEEELIRSVSGGVKRKQGPGNEAEQDQHQDKRIRHEQGQPVTEHRKVLGSFNGNSGPKKATKPTQARIILFGIKLTEILEDALSRLGVIKTEDINSCTHVITRKLDFSPEFLSVLSHGPEVVDLSWLDACLKSGGVADAHEYQLHSDEWTKAYDVGLQDTLERARAGGWRLLKNHIFYISPGIDEALRNGLRQVIESAGGTCELLYPGPTQMVERLQYKHVIGGEGESDHYRQLTIINIPIHNWTVVPRCILLQTLEAFKSQASLLC